MLPAWKKGDMYPGPSCEVRRNGKDKLRRLALWWSVSKGRTVRRYRLRGDPENPLLELNGRELHLRPVRLMSFSKKGDVRKSQQMHIWVRVGIGDIEPKVEDEEIHKSIDILQSAAGDKSVPKGGFSSSILLRWGQN